MNNLELFVEYIQTLPDLTLGSIWFVAGVFTAFFSFHQAEKKDVGIYDLDGPGFFLLILLVVGGLISFGVYMAGALVWKLSKIIVGWIG